MEKNQKKVRDRPSQQLIQFRVEQTFRVILLKTQQQNQGPDLGLPGIPARLRWARKVAECC